MKSRYVVWIVALAVGATFAIALFAQTAAQSGVSAVKKEPAVKPAPRTPDGKPDLSGIWGILDRATGLNRIAQEETALVEKLYGPLPKMQKPQMTPWEQERVLYNSDPRPGFGHREELNPEYHCVPFGPSMLALSSSGDDVGGYEIIQSPSRVLIFYERDHNIRQIWMDRQKHPDLDEMELTWMGDSIGKWDGDTLVVDTIGMRNEPWIDGGAHVSSTELHMVERYKRLDHDTMYYEQTLTDPKAFTAPWTRYMYRRLRNWHLAEDVRCYAGSPELRNEEDIFTTGNKNQ